MERMRRNAGTAGLFAAVALVGCASEEAAEPPVSRSARCVVETAFLCEENVCEPYEEAATINFDPAESEVEICSEAVGECSTSGVRFEQVEAASGAARFYRTVTTEEGILTFAEVGDPPALGSFTYSGARLRSLYVLMGQCR